MIDFSSVKKVIIPEGVVTKIVAAGKTLWQAITFTNQVPISTDTDGSIFNGTGYKDNVRLSSSGGVSGSAQNGSTTTGFIPFDGDTTVIRIKGVEWLNTYGSGHHYINFYDGSKEFLDYTSSAMYNNNVNTNVHTVIRDSNGVETVTFNTEYGTSNTFLQNVRKAKYIRITARGSGANMTVTINEEIT